MRRAEIERAIRRSLQNNRFEVYYQPTYYLDGFRLHGAEDYADLSVVAHQLKHEGFSLSMDDYVTGYSNMEGICRDISSRSPFPGISF